MAKQVLLGELANALDEAKRDGTTKSVTAEAGTASTSTFLSLDTPATLEGERADPESALANLITLLANAGILVDETTETAV